jgi:archaellum biogenesis ATPase FlaH
MLPLDFVRSMKWKYRITGDEIEVPCPFETCCNHGEAQFYINTKTGAWCCHRTEEERGVNIDQLKFRLGLVKLQEPTEGHIFVPDQEVLEMHHALLNNQEALTYLTNTRALSKSSIIQHKLGYLKSTDGDSIIFPYFDTKQRCVGWKERYYKKPDGVKPKARFKKGSKMQAYGLNQIDLAKPLIITEGEVDAIACWQYGYENVVSCPAGANNTEWAEEIKSAPMFLLCYDNDPAGLDGAEKLAEILGRSRCKRVFPRLKDIGDMLKVAIPKDDIEKMFDTAKPMFEAPITDITAYVDNALAVIKDPEGSKGVSTGWKSFDYYIGGIRMNEVTVATGITSHGKTTFSLSLIGNLLDHMNCLIISPEMKEQYLLLELASNFHKRKCESAEDLDSFIEEYKGKVHIAKVFDTWTDRKSATLLDKVFDIIEYGVKHHDIKFVMLDHLRLFLTTAEADKERSAIDEFMQRAVHTAITNKVHIWLIVQPKNLPSNQRKVTLMDLKGSSNIAQDAHNVILIHREMDDKKKAGMVEIQVAKNRELGACGTFSLEFDTNSRANYYDTDEGGSE